MYFFNQKKWCENVIPSVRYTPFRWNIVWRPSRYIPWIVSKFYFSHCSTHEPRQIAIFLGEPRGMVLNKIFKSWRLEIPFLPISDDNFGQKRSVNWSSFCACLFIRNATVVKDKVLLIPQTETYRNKLREIGYYWLITRQSVKFTSWSFRPSVYYWSHFSIITRNDICTIWVWRKYLPSLVVSSSRC